MSNHRPIWIAVVAFAGVLIFAGLIHLAFRTSAQLYLNMRETDEKQTKYIFEVDRRVDELERKLSVFEQHMKFEVEAKTKEKSK